MKCPVDQAELDEEKYESDIVIDRCPDCRGVWLDHRELEGIQESLERDYSSELQQVPDHVARAYQMARAEAAPTRPCPECGIELDRKEYGYCSQILIDACRQCRGVWLDRGELEALEVFFERARADAGELRRGFFGSLMSLIGA